MTNFEHDYILFDEFGLKEIRCMASGKVVANRVERESEKFQGKTSFQLSKHADYREIPYLLKDGSVCFLIFCDEHKGTEVGESEALLVTDQIRRAKIAELKNSGKTEDFIEKIMVGFERKSVVRKLTDDEIRDQFSNKLK